MNEKYVLLRKIITKNTEIDFKMGIITEIRFDNAVNVAL